MISLGEVKGLEGLEVSTRVLTPQDVWKDKEEFTERERASFELWEKMPENEREAIQAIVMRQLDLMHDHIDVWLPASLTMVNGGCIDVKFRLMFSDIEEEVQQEEEVTQRQVREAAENTKRLLDEMAPGAP